jgi:hypothetical protein
MIHLPALMVGISGTRDALRHNRTARGIGNNLWLLPPLDLLDANLPFDELVYVGHHDGSLDIHEGERWYRVARVASG